MKTVIIAYDIKDEKRRHAVRKLLKKYMLRRQYSVFIGELSQKHINEVKSEIKKLIDENEDSVWIIVILNPAYVEMNEYGVKEEFDFII